MDRNDWCPLHLTFSPSILEIRESKLTNAYSGGLSEYLQSIPELESSIRRAGIRVGVPSGRGGIRSYRSKRGANKYPEIFIHFLAFIGSAGIATVLYNILKTWAETKNGRKIRVRIGDFEVETTQMSEKQFMKLLDRLIVYKKAQIDDTKRDANPERRSARMSILRKELLKSGFKVSPVESYELDDEDVSSAAMDSIRQAQDALEGNLAKAKPSKARKQKRRN